MTRTYPKDRSAMEAGIPERVSIVCPCVGGQVFIPRYRTVPANMWAIPGGVMKQIPDRRCKHALREVWFPRYVPFAWIRDYARRTGQRLEWQPINLWRHDDANETGSA